MGALQVWAALMLQLARSKSGPT